MDDAVLLHKLQIQQVLAEQLPAFDELQIESNGRSLKSSETSDAPRVFCGVFTTEKNHQTKVRAISDTWAKKCSSFLAFSTADDLTLPAISLPHLGEESYANMWQKSRSIWKYIGLHYVDDFDWFLLGGDDMYYIMENLVALLTSPEVQEERKRGEGVYLGRSLRYPSITRPFLFNTGGSGYLLDKVALRKLVDHLERPICNPNMVRSEEDVLVALCLLLLGEDYDSPARVSVSSVLPFETRDHHGR